MIQFIKFPCHMELSRITCFIQGEMHPGCAVASSVFPPTLCSLFTVPAGQGMSWDSGALLFGGLGSCASRIIRDTRRPVHGMPLRLGFTPSFLSTLPLPQCPADQKILQKTQC